MRYRRNHRSVVQRRILFPPPFWLRPFSVLSTGQKFRVEIARALAEKKPLIVIDEFTSVVDRTVARIGSLAVAKRIRKTKQQLIAVSCHSDIIPWLAPDWIYRPHLERLELTRGRLRRPPIHLIIRRCDRSAWKFFRQYHYLTAEIHPAAECYVGFWEQQPICFCSVLHFPHPHRRGLWKEHRTVVLPDYQGAGIGNRLSEWLGEHLATAGRHFLSTTSHPSMIYHRCHSPRWRVTRALSRVSAPGKNAAASVARSQKRYTMGFEYIPQSRR